MAHYGICLPGFISTFMALQHNHRVTDANARVNSCEIFSDACMCRYVDFMTGPPAFVFVWLALLKESGLAKDREEFAPALDNRCMCGTHPTFPQLLYIFHYTL